MHYLRNTSISMIYQLFQFVKEQFKADPRVKKTLTDKLKKQTYLLRLCRAKAQPTYNKTICVNIELNSIRHLYVRR